MLKPSENCNQGDLQKLIYDSLCKNRLLFFFYFAVTIKKNTCAKDSLKNVLVTVLFKQSS